MALCVIVTWGHLVDTLWTDRQNDRNGWRHFIPSTSLVGGNSLNSSYESFIFGIIHEKLGCTKTISETKVHHHLATVGEVITHDIPPWKLVLDFKWVWTFTLRNFNEINFPQSTMPEVATFRPISKNLLFPSFNVHESVH